MKIGYYAIFSYNEIEPTEFKISIQFPDIEDGYTSARNEEEGKKFALEVLELTTANLKVHELPKNTSLKDIRLSENESVHWIEYETSEYVEEFPEK